MDIEETKKFASAIGIPAQNFFSEMDALVHIIQLEMGYAQCFNSNLGCAIPPNMCLWIAECKNNPLNHPVKHAA